MIMMMNVMMTICLGCMYVRDGWTVGWLVGWLVGRKLYINKEFFGLLASNDRVGKELRSCCE
jgi:hypothetical protein